MKFIPWIERKFNFDFPVTNFPIIVCRLNGLYPRLKYLIENVATEKLKYKSDGKWSVLEHIGHLIDLDELHIGRIIDYKNHEYILRAADMSNKKTQDANHNNKNITMLLDELRIVRNEFLDALNQFSEAELSHSALHPRLNTQMRIVDMAYFVAEHDDHHVAGIFQLCRSC